MDKQVTLSVSEKDRRIDQGEYEGIREALWDSSPINAESTTHDCGHHLTSNTNRARCGCSIHILG